MAGIWELGFQEGSHYSQNWYEWHCPHAVTTHSWGKLSTSFMIPLGKYSLKLVPSFLWSLPHKLGPFADFVLYLLAVINHSHKCNYMLSSVSCPSESLKLEMVLGNYKTCTHTHIYSLILTAFPSMYWNLLSVWPLLYFIIVDLYILNILLPF